MDLQLILERGDSGMSRSALNINNFKIFKKYFDKKKLKTKH